MSSYIDKFSFDSICFFEFTAYETYYRAIKEASSISKKEMISVPVIEKPIEIDKLVKQIKTELD
jgi:hypothetical protein